MRGGELAAPEAYSPYVEGRRKLANEADGPLSSPRGGNDADDAMEGCLGDVESARAVDHDAARIAELAGHRGYLAGRRDPEDLAYVESATDEHAPVGPCGEVRPLIVTGGQAGQEPKLAVGSEAKDLADGAQEDEIVGDRRHADEPPQGLPAGSDLAVAREDWGKQIGAARERPVLVNVHAKHHGPPVAFFREPAERRRQRRLRPKMGLRARIVEEDQPPQVVEGYGAPAEEMVQPHGHRSQMLVRPESIDTITVLLAEEEIPAAGIHREASQRRLPRLAREGNHHQIGRAHV